MLLQILLLSAIAFIVFKLFFQKGKTRSPPGPFKWPIIGNLPQLYFSNPKYPHRGMAKLAETYGDIMSIKYGVHNSVVISSYETIKDLLTREEMAGRYEKFPFVESRSFHDILGLVFQSGDTWREQRRYTIRNLREFGFGKRNATASILDEELKQFLEDIQTKLDKRNGMLTIEGKTFSLTVVNILWALVAGYRFSHQDKRLNHISELSEAVMQAGRFDNLSVPFPALAYYFPELTSYNSNKKCFVEMQDFMREMIHKAKNDFDVENGDPRTFIECFIKDINTSKNTNESIFTEEHLINVLADLYVAGSDTTSNSLAYGLLYMILNPNVQKKVQDEISVITNDDPDFILDASYSSQMPYTEATILEISRMAHVLALPFPRKAMADYVYKGYLIPKDTALFFNLSAVLMSKKYWGDPEDFRPERFLDSTGTKIVNTEKLIAFGLGKRVCLGETLARDSMFTYFTTLLKNYTFKIPPGQKPPTTDPQPSFSLGPYPFDVVMIPRKV